jgi:hypothetical protein
MTPAQPARRSFCRFRAAQLAFGPSRQAAFSDSRYPKKNRRGPVAVIIVVLILLLIAVIEEKNDAEMPEEPRPASARLPILPRRSGETNPLQKKSGGSAANEGPVVKHGKRFLDSSLAP